uniref:Uncharacterized protein n=1 Tax=Anguilla anguilla TaxID=7936 RepID=A0A0E9T5W6_ANGAN
MGKLIHASAIF